MLLAGAYRAQPQLSLQRAWLGSGSGSSPVSCTRGGHSVSAQPNRCAPEVSFCRLARCMARRRRSGHTAAWLRTGPCTYPCELSNSLSHHPRARASWQRRSTRRSRPRPALLHYKHAARARQAVSSVDAGREAWWQRHTARRGVERQHRAQLHRSHAGGGELRPASEEMRDPPPRAPCRPAGAPASTGLGSLPPPSVLVVRPVRDRSAIASRLDETSTARRLFAQAGCAGCAGHWLQTRGSSPHRQCAGHFVAIEAPVGATALRRRLPLPRRYSPMCRLLQLV
jgi:hypothetical protein